jgi:hypothetical protein
VNIEPADAKHKGVVWTVSGGTAGAVSSDGIFLAALKGTYTIKASAGGKSGSKTITITDERQAGTYTITFETDSGKSIRPQSYNAGQKLSLPIPVEEGYNFLGWYSNEWLTSQFVAAVMPSNDITRARSGAAIS